MAYLSRADILGADDLVSQDVAVKEWGGTVRVQTMTGTDRDAYESAMIDDTGKVKVKDIKVRLVTMSLVGEDGKRLFTDADIKALGRKSALALDRVAEVAMRLNGLSDSDVQELAGNSDAAPGGNDTSV